VTGDGTGVFVTDAGAEFSVRAVQHHSSTSTTTLEPLYATDLDVMDGLAGELRGKAGDRLRGTLRRRGNVFVLSPEQPPDTMSTTAQSTVSSPSPGSDPKKPAPQRTGSQTAAREVPPAAAPNRRGDRRKPAETKAPAPPVTPPAARRAKPREETVERAPVATPPPPPAQSNRVTREIAPSQSEAIDALKIVADFLRAPSAVSPPLRAESGEPTSEAAPSQAEAIEAARVVAQFLRDDPDISVEVAKHAQSIVSRFIAAREVD
jgi:hypothetical protein